MTIVRFYPGKPRLMRERGEPRFAPEDTAPVPEVRKTSRTESALQHVIAFIEGHARDNGVVLGSFGEGLGKRMLAQQLVASRGAGTGLQLSKRVAVARSGQMIPIAPAPAVLVAERLMIRQKFGRARATRPIRIGWPIRAAARAARRAPVERMLHELVFGQHQALAAVHRADKEGDVGGGLSRPARAACLAEQTLRTERTRARPFEFNRFDRSYALIDMHL